MVNNIKLKAILLISASFMLTKLSYGQDEGKISADGKYVWAAEDKSIDGTGRMLIIQSTINGWKKEIIAGGRGNFTADCRQLFFQRNDTVFAVTLGGKKMDALITGAESYKIQQTKIGEWLICKLKNDELILENTKDHDRYNFPNVRDWIMDSNGNLVLKEVKENWGNIRTMLEWVNLSDGAAKEIWSGENEKISNYQLDENNGQLGFIVNTKIDSAIHYSIWQYKPGMKKAQEFANDKVLVSDKMEISDDPITFTQGGTKLIFTLKEAPEPKLNPCYIDIWSYTDPKLYSLQRKDKVVQKKFVAVINLINSRLIRLESGNEKLARFGSDLQIDDDYALICNFKGDCFAYDQNGNVVEGYSMIEYNWNKSTESSVYLVSLKDGSRTLLNKNIRAKGDEFPYYQFSPTGKYVVYYNSELNNYFSFELKTSITRNITSSLSSSWTNADPEDAARSYNLPVGITNWTKDDAYLFIPDHFSDYWKIDPLNIKKPENLTNGYAKNNHNKSTQVSLSIMLKKEHPIIQNEPLLFHAFIGALHGYGYSNDGFFIKNPATNEKLHILIQFGAKYQYQIQDYNVNKCIYLVTKSNSDTPPINYFTRDFKKFIAVTSNFPDKRIGKGVRKQLVTWHDTNGTLCQGVLCYPKDFDTGKKYPVIFWCYEKKAGDLNFEQYNKDGGMLFYRPGYFLFYPDIHLNLGHTGIRAYNDVVSGAKCIAKLPFINSKKMALTGASFSGYETNFIVTHSNLFACAVSECGVSDFFSDFGNMDNDQIDAQQSGMIETGQWRMGTTMWERPDIYLENSPVFYADRVTTPILIDHAYSDERCPFRQSVEFFKALRRLGKPAWLVANDYGGQPSHGGSGVLWSQFLDHYLKDAPAPKWMLGGLPEPAQLKPAEYQELDSTGREPGPGVRYAEESRTPQQQELYDHRTRVTDQGRIVDVRSKRKHKKLIRKNK